jgi:hypothetical protein
MDPQWLHCSAAGECFTSVPKPQNWLQFSRAPVLPPCCKACTLAPHPFIYRHLQCSQGVGKPDCGRVDARVWRMKTGQAKMQP